MKIRYRFTVVALAALNFAGATHQSPDPRCFKLIPGAWSSQQLERAHRFPDFIRLDTAAFRDFSATPASVLRTSFTTDPPRFAAWRQFPGDSIEFGWGNGFVGIQVRGDIRGDTIIAVAEAWTDMLGMANPTAPLTGFRTACPDQLSKF